MITPPQQKGIYQLTVWLSANGTTEPFLHLPLTVLPAADAVVFGQTLDPDWNLEPNARVTLTTAEIDGRTGLAFEPAGSWRVDGTTSAPIDFFGFEALNLAFHPGTATITEGRSPRLRLQTEPGNLVDILPQIDLENPTWQTIKLTLEDLGIDGTLPLEGLALNGGNLQGTFYLGDIRLLAQALPEDPISAVLTTFLTRVKCPMWSATI